MESLRHLPIPFTIPCAPLARRLRVPFAALLAAATLAMGANGQGTVTGTLDATGVSLDNGLVRIHVSKDNTDPIEIDVTDLGTNHSYLIGGDTDLWRAQLVDAIALAAHTETLKTVGDLNCRPQVGYVKVDTFVDQSLTLNFTVCTNAMGTDKFSLQAKIVLADGARIADWQLIAPTTTMTKWSFWNAGYNLSVFEDHTDPNQEYTLLSSWGMATTNPGEATITNYPGNFHSPTQLSGYYDSDGNGLYVATADGTGDYPKEFLYESLGNDRVRIFHRQYFDDSFNTADGFTTIPLRVGRFTGDWFDAAEIYRDWLDGTTITSRGPLVSRTDIADTVKNTQMVGVITQCIGWQPEDYTCATGCLWGPVAGRTLAFKAHHQLDHVSTLQFGPGWPVNSGCGVGKYTINSSALGNMFEMESNNLNYGVYLFDAFYSEADASWLSENWAANASINSTGDTQHVTSHSTCDTLNPCTLTHIDPSTTAWKNRMTAVGQALGAEGVDGVFVDNLFPQKMHFCFSTQHGHSPGFGPYLIRGYAETFQNLRSGADPNEQFFTYTEAFVEGYIRNGSAYTPMQNSGDWMTNDSDTRFIPLLSALFHHYVVLGPGGGLGYLPQLTSAEPASSVARRDAAFQVAYAWINGTPIWTLDMGMANPKDLKFAYEVAPGTHPHYTAIAAFEGRVARMRGQAQTKGFLNTGVRLRDLAITTPNPMPTVNVNLLGVDTLTGGEVQTVPSLMTSVWKKADDVGQFVDEVAVVFVNHSASNLNGISFTFDPAAYGMNPAATLKIYETDADTPTVETPILTFTGSLTTGLPGGVASEDVRFFRIGPP
jgi:hypothetical protein